MDPSKSYQQDESNKSQPHLQKNTKKGSTTEVDPKPKKAKQRLRKGKWTVSFTLACMIKEVILNKFLVGANYPNGNNYADTAYFRGEISEFNIWSEALGTEELKKLTSHCGKPLPEPDILNWSEIDTSMLTGNNFQSDIEILCRNSNETPTIYKVMPYFQNQEEAIHTCQILNGQLAYPKSIKEYQEWQGKDW